MTDPTGLDYHAAYEVMYPGLVAEGIRLQDVQSNILRAVDRAARLRRNERERVKGAFSQLATELEIEVMRDAPSVSHTVTTEVIERIRKLIEEIR